MDKAKGGRPTKKTPCVVQGVSTLDDLGIEYTQSHRWQAISRLPARAFNDHIAECRRKLIFDMWLACHTQQEIADAVGIHKDTVSEEMELRRNLDKCPKSDKLTATFQEPDWVPPLYDIWTFAKNPDLKHFGNTHSLIVENLIYTFTEPPETNVSQSRRCAGTIIRRLPGSLCRLPSPVTQLQAASCCGSPAPPTPPR